MSLFATCEADGGLRRGRRRNVPCGERAVVEVRDGAGVTVPLCESCAAWLARMTTGLEQTLIGGDAA